MRYQPTHVSSAVSLDVHNLLSETRTRDSTISVAPMLSLYLCTEVYCSKKLFFNTIKSSVVQNDSKSLNAFWAVCPEFVDSALQIGLIALKIVIALIVMTLMH